MTSPFRRRVVWLALAVGLIGGGIALWTEVLRDRIVAKRWGVVEPGFVYRSGQVSRHLVESQLREHGIRVVVDLMGDDPGNREQPFEREAISRLGIELVKCPLIGDGTGDPREYVRAVAAIDRARKSQQPVLVHCYAGSQRTGGVVALYRLLVRGEAPEAILAELPRYDWRPARDRILLDYLDRHRDEITRGLREQGVAVIEPTAGLSFARMQYGGGEGLARRDGAYPR
jgi:hypothetical protein